ncbi:substrate-binding periplasmic protein [Spongorhabdus nitratireducens]
MKIWSGFIQSFCLVAVLLSGLATAQQEKKVITVGLYPEDYPPLFWHQEKQGIIQLTLEAIERVSNYQFETQVYPFNRLIKKVADGELDLEAWTSPAWRQNVKDHVFFTSPITEHCEVMVFPKGKKIQVQSAPDLFGKKVGTVASFTFPSYQDHFESKKITRVDALDENHVFKMLSFGRTELAFMDALVAQHLMKSNWSKEFELGERFDCVPVAFMFSKDKAEDGREINKILQQLKQQGKIEEILDRFR